MIDVSLCGEVLTLTAHGDLDLAERGRFAELTARVVGSDAADAVVDLCGVGFVDSAGAAFLTSVASAVLGRGGRVRLRGADEQVLFVLDVCGALSAFEVDADHRCPPTTGLGPWRSARAPG